MPSGNQGRSNDQGRQNGGAARGAHETVQNAGQKVQQGAEQIGQRLSEGYESTREELARRYRNTEGMIARNPTPSVLVGFGIGFGLGLVITSILAERERETWADKHVPDRLRNLPDSLQSTLNQLSEQVRNLPDSLASYLPKSMTRR